MKHLYAIAFGLLTNSLFAAPAQAEDAYFDTLVKLETPKQDGKRSTEGGLEHIPFRIWLPDGVATIRGITFNPFYTNAVTQKHWQAACRQWDFGILAANFFGAKQEEFPKLIDSALAEFARKSGHPELAGAKFCLVGMSAGAGMSVNIARLMPDRVIAAGPVCLEVGPRSPESMAIPMLTIFGERDGGQYEKLMARLPEAREQGARFGIAVQWRRKHEFARANNLLMPFFDAVIRRRLGKPGEALRDFDERIGWLGNVAEWGEGIATIAPFDEYQGDKFKACWFPDATTAKAWQAFVTREPVLELKSPPGLGDGQPFILHEVGAPMTVEMKSNSKTDPSKLVEVFAGARRLGQLQNGTLEISFDKPGIYPLLLQANAADGSKLLSRPNTLVVTGVSSDQ